MLFTKISNLVFRMHKSPVVKLGILFLGGLYSLGLSAQQVDVPDDYDSIQAAINAISENSNLGNTIFVEAGTYEENITVDLAITIQGEETARTIIQPRVDEQPIVSINNVSGVTLRNLTFNSGDVGVEVTNSTDVTITNNVFKLHDDASAVQVDGASDAQVLHNVFYDNDTALERENDLVEIRNNIFARNFWAIVGDGDFVDHNCFFENDFTEVFGTNSIRDDDPLFVDVAKLDFHLQEDSPCIDAGDGEKDAIDDSLADMGVYGGEHADAFPFPVQNITLTDLSSTQPATIQVEWERNTGYLVTHTTEPGGYELYYDSDQSGPPYNGADADGGASPIDVQDVSSFQLAGLSVDSVAPDAPEITEISPENGQVTLKWTAVPGATAYNVYYGVSSVTDEELVELGNTQSHTVKGLINGTSYLFAVSAKAQDRYYVAIRAYDSTDDKKKSD